MTKELIQNLRSVGRLWEDEAADALEAQQKRIEQLEADYLKTHNWLCDRNEQLAVSQGRKTKLAAELAASQAQIKVLRDALESVVEYEHGFCTHPDDLRDIAKAALAIPTDDSALRELLKAERERCAKVADAWDHDKRIAAAIRAMGSES